MFRLNFVILLAISKTATSPRTWSVDDVARLVEKTDLKDYVNLFRENVSACSFHNFLSVFCFCYVCFCLYPSEVSQFSSFGGTLVLLQP